MVSLAKPQMRGLQMSMAKKHTLIAVILAFSAGLATKIFVKDSRDRQIMDYYK